MVRVLGFDLQPVTRACLLVRACAMLGDDTFELVLRNSSEEIVAASFHVVVVPHPTACGRNEFSKNGLPMLERKSAEIVAVHVQQIEGIVVDRDTFVGLRDVV